MNLRPYLLAAVLISVFLATPILARNIQFEIINGITKEKTAVKVAAIQNGNLVPPAIRETDVHPELNSGKFYTMGQFVLNVSAGNLTVKLEKGFSFRPVTYSLTIPASGSAKVTLAIFPWFDHTFSKWQTGDTHIHITPKRTQLASYKHLAVTAAEGIQFAYLLSQSSKNKDTYYNPDPADQWYYEQLAGYGDVSDFMEGGYFISSGHEYHAPLDGFGHSSIICLSGLPFGNGPNTHPERFPPLATIYDQIKTLNGFMGHNHHGGVSEFLIDVALGKSDFKERDDNEVIGRQTYTDWFRALNSGTVVSFTAASDYDLNLPTTSGTGVLPGVTYVYMGDSISPRSWAQHLKWGQSFISNGPVVFFRIEDKGPGQFLAYPGSGSRIVEVEAFAFSENDPMLTLSLKKNGGSGFVHSVAADPDGKSAHFKTAVTVSKSAWFCVYAEGANKIGPNTLEAVSGAITVMLDRQLPVVTDNGNVSLQKTIEVVQTEINQVNSSSYGVQAEKDSVLNVFNRALGFYQTLLQPPPTNDPPPSAPTGLRVKSLHYTQQDFMKVGAIMQTGSIKPIWN